MSIDDLAAELIMRANDETVTPKPIDVRVTAAVNDMARALYSEGVEMRAVMCAELLHSALLAFTSDFAEDDFIRSARVAYRAYALSRRKGAN